LDRHSSISQFCKFALIPQPLLPEREKGSRIESSSPALGEGFRVRAAKVGCTPGILTSRLFQESNRIAIISTKVNFRVEKVTFRVLTNILKKVEFTDRKS
jgi:hypothetical protein